MTTNRDWLFGLPLEEQYAWMNAEHVESPTSRETAQDGQVHQESGERSLESVTAALERKSDSREKIEAEALKLFLNYPRIDEKSAYFLTGCVAGFLDRQEAITKSQCCDAQLDKERKDWQRWCEDAERECSKLQAQVDKLTYERERYRSKFGKCIDYADAIHALMGEIDEGWS